MSDTYLELPTAFRLRNGTFVPAVGLGTFQGDMGNSKIRAIVLSALRNGYRHIDTAAAYGNEEEIGHAIRESKIPREELYITTKLAQTWHKSSDVAVALQESLKKLQLEYGVNAFRDRFALLALNANITSFPHAYAAGPGNGTIRHPSGNGKVFIMLSKSQLHTDLPPKPVIDYPLSRAYPETWKAMEGLVESGKARSIGLSNFNVLKTRRILEVAKLPPLVNQVELHPYFPQHELMSFCRQEGIHLIAHQPLGGKPLSVVNPNLSRPGPLVDPKIIKVAAECGRSPAQVILSWGVQRGTAVIPKTATEERLAENRNLLVLSQEHFQMIDSLAQDIGPVRYLDPSGHIGFDIFDEYQDQPVGDNAPWDEG